MIDAILKRIVDAYRDFPFIRAIVLGGSHATGTATPNSDIDIGIYYDSSRIDYGLLNCAAKELDDLHRDNLICEEGGWGCWVNCGGWLTVDNFPVDIILRDWERVSGILESSELGHFSCHYQTGHPHAFTDVMYRGELASCKVLFTRDDNWLSAKKQAEHFPVALRDALSSFFLFEAGFSCGFIEKYAELNDPAYLSGHAFRSVSALNQVLFALNGKWLLNEKKAVLRIEGFDHKPSGYQDRIKEILAGIVHSPTASAALLRKLCDETEALHTAITCKSGS